MKPVPLRLPPGAYGNGANYSAQGRWRSTNLVRWIDGFLRAVGGWARRRDTAEVIIPPLVASPATSAMRALFAWRDNAGSRYLAAGSTAALQVVSATGVVTTITPAGFTPGNKNSGLIAGYGVGQYGKQAYGTARSGDGLLAAPVGNWRFDAWGQDLLAAGPLDTTTRLYKWSPGDLIATVVANAPTGFSDFLVTDERIVMVIGHGANGRDVAWSDRENNTQWTSNALTYAGSRTLPGKGKLTSITKVGSEYLIVGETDAFRVRYSGAPFVYDIRGVGSDCGPLSVQSVVVAEGRAYWPSDKEFWCYDGGTLKAVNCEIQDYFNGDLASTERSKVYGVHLSSFNEIWWFYQSTGGTLGDCDSYISYNYMTGAWAYGRLPRSAALDVGVVRNVIMASPAGELYNHELPETGTGSEVPYARSGPIQIAEGEAISYVHYIYPGEENLGDVVYYIYARDMPSAPTRVYGPYGARNPIPTRARGREIEIEVRGVAANFKIGEPRLLISGDGDR